MSEPECLLRDCAVGSILSHRETISYLKQRINTSKMIHIEKKIKSGWICEKLVFHTCYAPKCAWSLLCTLCFPGPRQPKRWSGWFNVLHPGGNLCEWNVDSEVSVTNSSWEILTLPLYPRRLSLGPPITPPAQACARSPCSQEHKSWQVSSRGELWFIRTF